MRIGITGSTGLIGSQVVAALQARGDEIVRFVRPDTKAVAERTVRWNPRLGDVDETDLANVGGLDGIIHLAGAGIADRRWTPTYRAEILSSRTTTTSLLAEIASRLPDGLPTLVSGSAIGYYGNGGDRVLDEAAASGTDYVAEVCRAWEDAAQPLTAAGTHVSFARTGIVLSPRGGALAKLLPIFRLGVGGQIGNGRQWMSPIAIDDEVAALLFALDTRMTGAFNVVAPEPCTNKDFTKALAKHLHRPGLFPVPIAAMKLVLGTECADNTVLTSQRVVPTALLEQGFTFRATNIAEMLRAVL